MGKKKKKRIVALDLSGHIPKVVHVATTKKAAEKFIYNAAKEKLVKAEGDSFIPQKMHSLKEIKNLPSDWFGRRTIYVSNRFWLVSHVSGGLYMTEFRKNSYGEWEENECGAWTTLSWSFYQKM